MLATVCFDWSHGEYGDDYIPDIFLGIDEFETKEECFKQFAIDLAKAKKVIEAELDKTVFNKIREGENLLS